jgi:DNA-binding transcriptional ArsR family regulator
MKLKILKNLNIDTDGKQLVLHEGDIAELIDEVARPFIASGSAEIILSTSKQMSSDELKKKIIEDCIQNTGYFPDKHWEKLGLTLEEYNEITNSMLNVDFKYEEEIQRWKLKSKDELISECAEALINNPEPLCRIRQVLDKLIVGEYKNKLLVFLLGLTKDLDSKNAQAGYIIGGSSAGKSYLLHQTLRLLVDEYDEENNPEGKLLWLTRSSTHGLEYYCNKFACMDGYVLYVEEAPGWEDAQASIRPIFSEKGLKIVIAEKSQGKMSSKEIKVKGCPVFFSTSTVSLREDQMATRVWILHIDETEEQTKNILEFQKKSDKYLETNEEDAEILIVKATLKKLEKFNKILIPYTNEIEFPYSQIRARRDFQKFRTLIKVSAYIHQKNRPKLTIGEKKYLVATLADYYIAHALMKDVLVPILYNLTQDVLDLLDICKTLKDNAQEITVKNVTLKTSLAQPTIRKHLDDLVRSGKLVKEKLGRENLYTIIEGKSLELPFINLDSLKGKFDEKKFNEWQTEILGEKKFSYDEICSNVYDPTTDITISRHENEGNVILPDHITSDVIRLLSITSPSTTERSSHDTGSEKKEKSEEDDSKREEKNTLSNNVENKEDSQSVKEPILNPQPVSEEAKVNSDSKSNPSKKKKDSSNKEKNSSGIRVETEEEIENWEKM